jgi:hypothetical protein
VNKIHTIKNEEDGTEIYIFDREDTKLPFGVRFADLDANETIAVFHCPTLENAYAKVALLTQSGAVSVTL